MLAHLELIGTTDTNVVDAAALAVEMVIGVLIIVVQSKCSGHATVYTELLVLVELVRSLNPRRVDILLVGSTTVTTVVRQL